MLTVSVCFRRVSSRRTKIVGAVSTGSRQSAGDGPDATNIQSPSSGILVAAGEVAEIETVAKSGGSAT